MVNRSLARRWSTFLIVALAISPMAPSVSAAARVGNSSASAGATPAPESAQGAAQTCLEIAREAREQRWALEAKADHARRLAEFMQADADSLEFARSGIVGQIQAGRNWVSLAQAIAVVGGVYTAWTKAAAWLGSPAVAAIEESLGIMSAASDPGLVGMVALLQGRRLMMSTTDLWISQMEAEVALAELDAAIMDMRVAARRLQEAGEATAAEADAAWERRFETSSECRPAIEAVPDRCLPMADLGSVWLVDEAGIPGRWTRIGSSNSFKGEWDNDAVADLTMTVCGSEVTIQRVDTAGPSAGWRITYTGTILAGQDFALGELTFPGGTASWSADIIRR